MGGCWACACVGVMYYCADFPCSYARSPARRVLYVLLQLQSEQTDGLTDFLGSDSTTVQYYVHTAVIQYLPQYRAPRSSFPRSAFVIAVARQPTWAEMLAAHR